MYPASDQCVDQETLMKQLNALLTSLHLPIPLTSPTDLTPRLLIAILESLMDMRLPINYSNEPRHTHAEKVEAMKIFLGVLETDFLQIDAGLSDIDPRRLADGEWEEVFFIAQLLCWIGRRADLVSSSDLTPPEPQKQRLSPKSQLDLDAESLFQTGSTVSGIGQLSERTFSPFLKESGGDSVTTANDTFEDQHGGSTSDTDAHNSFTNPPRCIHQITSPSLLFSVDSQIQSSSPTLSPDHNWSFCDCHPSIAKALPIEHDHPDAESQKPIHTTRFIQPVDEEAELASFENSRLISFSDRRGPEHSRNHVQSASQRAARLLAVHEQYTRTVYLLNERARLLTELADFENS